MATSTLDISAFRLHNGTGSTLRRLGLDSLRVEVKRDDDLAFQVDLAFDADDAVAALTALDAVVLAGWAAKWEGTV